MANKSHVRLLKQSTSSWNIWRIKNPGIRPDLKGANLKRAQLAKADLAEAYLAEAKLAEANLLEADLTDANLCNVDLSGAILRGSNLTRSNLRKANLTGTVMTETLLDEADLSEATVSGAVFGNVSLSNAKGLETCIHLRPSTVNHRTLILSGNLPPAFLRGCGLNDIEITAAKLYEASLSSSETAEIIQRIRLVLSNNATQYHSCFISYSSADGEFADRLYESLQNAGVRCWYAPDNIVGGKKIHEQLIDSIRHHDRLLLILSEHSMESDWVATEIASAREQEESQGKKILLPIRLVDFERIKTWRCFDADRGKDSAREIREYFIPDFTNWKDQDAYTESFNRLLKDLTTETASRE